MNRYLENLITMLSVNELYQLGIILDISSNGTRIDIYKKISKSYKFDYIYSKILELSKYKYFRKCYSINKKNHIILSNYRLLEKNNKMEHDYILYKNVECDVCNGKTIMHEYDNLFNVKTDDSVYESESINDSLPGKDRDIKLIDKPINLINRINETTNEPANNPEIVQPSEEINSLIKIYTTPGNDYFWNNTTETNEENKNGCCLFPW